MDPARMFKESLTSLPELENSQGQSRWSAPESGSSGPPPAPDMSQYCANLRDGPTPDLV